MSDRFSSPYRRRERRVAGTRRTLRSDEACPRVTWLSNEDLLSVTERLIVECVDRGIPVPEP